MKAIKKSNLIWILILIAAVLLAACELIFPNLWYYKMNSMSLSETALKLEDAKISEGTLTDTARIFIKKTASAEFDSVETAVKSVSFVMTADTRIMRADIYIRDDNYSKKYTLATTFRFVPDGERQVVKINPVGVLHGVRIVFRSDCAGNYVCDFAVNSPVGFHFNRLRYLILLTVASVIIFVVVYRLYRIRFDGENRSHRTLPFLLAGLVMLVMLLMSSGSTPALVKYPSDKPLEKCNIYTQLFDAFLHGRTDIDIPFDNEALAGLENPYDYSLRNEQLGKINELWDHAYYNGKLYCYFGAVPVLVLFFPFYFLTGMLPNDALCSLIFSLFAIVSLLLLLRKLLLHYRLTPPLFLVCPLAVALVSASAVFILNAQNVTYFYVLISALAFTALSLTFAYTACDTSSRVKRNVYLSLAAVAVVLAVGSRPTVALYSLIAAPVYVKMFFSRPNTGKRLAACAFFFVPLLAGAAGIMAYNYARFGSVLDFGSAYQLTVCNAGGFGIEFYKLFPSVYHYFLQPPVMNGYFPFIFHSDINVEAYRGWTYITKNVGALCFPLCACTVSLPFVKKNREITASATVAVVTAVFIGFTDMCLAGVHLRYTSDIMFPLALTGAIALCHLLSGSGQNDTSIGRRSYYFAKMLIYSTIIMAFAFVFANENNLVYKNNPSLFMLLDGLFR